MAFTPLGLGALVVAAIRTAVTDPQVAENARIAREGFDSLNSQVAELSASLAANGNVDEDQQATLDGIQEELAALATALAGPADDDDDNGVIGEVEPSDDVDPSPAADGVLNDEIVSSDDDNEDLG